MNESNEYNLHHFSVYTTRNLKAICFYCFLSKDNMIMTTLDEIKKNYKEKKAEVHKEISIEFDTVLNEIYSKYEQDYRDMGKVKKEQKELKDRISELKTILKLFNKEIKILTRNKKKALKQRISELKREKAEEIEKLEESS